MSKHAVPFFRTPYNYDTLAVSNETGLFCDDESRTSQEFTESCDPNYILARHESGADLNFSVQQRQPLEGDFTQFPPDYHTALNQITYAKAEFMKLPARIRAQFDNDPGQFLAFAADPANHADLVKLGFATARVESSDDHQRSQDDESTLGAPRAPNSNSKGSKAQKNAPKGGSSSEGDGD